MTAYGKLLKKKFWVEKKLILGKLLTFMKVSDLILLA